VLAWVEEGRWPGMRCGSISGEDETTDIVVVCMSEVRLGVQGVLFCVLRSTSRRSTVYSRPLLCLIYCGCGCRGFGPEVKTLTAGLEDDYEHYLITCITSFQAPILRLLPPYIQHITHNITSP
jgi:hypothetical protein